MDTQYVLLILLPHLSLMPMLITEGQYRGNPESEIIHIIVKQHHIRYLVSTDDLENDINRFDALQDMEIPGKSESDPTNTVRLVVINSCAIYKVVVFLTYT